jgi:hypothetical protein
MKVLFISLRVCDEKESIILFGPLRNELCAWFRGLVKVNIGNYVVWYVGFGCGFENNLTVMFL